MIPEFSHFQKFGVIVIIWLAFSAVADCAIAIALVWHLVCVFVVVYTILALTKGCQRKHKTGFAATDDIVNRIIRCTLLTLTCPYLLLIPPPTSDRTDWSHHGCVCIGGLGPVPRYSQ